MSIINVNGRVKSDYVISNTIFSMEGSFTIKDVCKKIELIIPTSSLESSVKFVLNNLQDKNVVDSDGVTYILNSEYRRCVYE